MLEKLPCSDTAAFNIVNIMKVLATMDDFSNDMVHPLFRMGKRRNPALNLEIWEMFWADFCHPESLLEQADMICHLLHRNFDVGGRAGWRRMFFFHSFIFSRGKFFWALTGNLGSLRSAFYLRSNRRCLAKTMGLFSYR